MTAQVRPLRASNSAPKRSASANLLDYGCATYKRASRRAAFRSRRSVAHGKSDPGEQQNAAGVGGMAQQPIRPARHQALSVEKLHRGAEVTHRA